MYESIERYIERLMRESAPERPVWNIENILQGKKPRFNYIDGCMMTALLSIYEETKEQAYFDFVESFVDWYIFEDGSIRGYKLEDYVLDDVNEGRVLFDLYKKTGKEKYRKAISLLNSQLETQPRTDEGSFWHKKIYHDQVWLDGLYMAQVFRTRYANETGDEEIYADVVRQFENARRIMFDEDRRLYYHGYDSKKTMFWANDKGLSSSFWLRAEGWFTVALADVIGYMPSGERKERLCEIFREALDGLLYYLAPEKMFYQVIDQASRAGNYLETSGSAMVSYALMKGARIGVLEKCLGETGREIFDGICKTRLTEKDGSLNLGGICLVAGLGPEDNTRRNGSYEYYISEPVVENDAKGVGPFAMAYSEIKKLK